LDPDRLLAGGAAVLLDFTDFFQHAFQIKMSQSIFGVQCNSAPEYSDAFSRFHPVVERPAIDQYLGPSGIDAQSKIVGIDRWAPVFPSASYSSAVASHSSALRPGHDTHSFLKLASLEINTN